MMATPTERKAEWALLAALFSAVAFAVYFRALTAPFFSMDDHSVILANTHITRFSVGNMLDMLELPTAAQRAAGGYYPVREEYYPVRDLSFAINGALFGVSAPSFRIVNVALHVMVALALVRLLREVGVGFRTAAFMAGLFLVHPIAVEPVVWISGRKDLLVTFFSLIVVGGVIRIARAPDASRGRYLLTLLCFLLALLSKGSALALVPLLPVVYFCFSDPPRWRRFLRLAAPFAVLTALYVVPFLTFRFAHPSLQSLPSYGFEFRWLTSIKVFAFALGLAALPVRQSTYVNLIHAAHDPWWMGAAYVAVAGLYVLCAVWAWRRSRPVAAGLLMFAIALAPYLNIIPNPILIAERYVYFPMVGLLLAAGAAAALPRLSVTDPGTRKRLALLGGLLLVPLALWSSTRGALWLSHEAYWRDATLHFPVSAVSWVHLGNSHAKQNEWKEACEAYAAARRLRPAVPELKATVLQNSGLCRVHERRMDEAASLFAECRQTGVCSPEGYLQGGLVEELAGRRQAAAAIYREGAARHRANRELAAALHRISAGAAD